MVSVTPMAHASVMIVPRDSSVWTVRRVWIAPHGAVFNGASWRGGNLIFVGDPWHAFVANLQKPLPRQPLIQSRSERARGARWPPKWPLEQQECGTMRTSCRRSSSSRPA